MLNVRADDLMSPAAMNTGSLLSKLVMLSTENWLMLSQLLVWISGSCRKDRGAFSKPPPPAPPH